MRSPTTRSFGHLSPASTPATSRDRVGQRERRPPSTTRCSALGAERAGAAAPTRAATTPGGASHVRPSRPRPAVWWSATATSPSARAAARLVEQVAVRGVELGEPLARRRTRAAVPRCAAGSGTARRIRRPVAGPTRGDTVARKDPDREPRRDRRPRHAHLPRARHRHRRRVLRARPRRRCTSATPTRPTRSAARPRPRATSTPTRSSTRSSTSGADGRAPRLRLLLRERRLRPGDHRARASTWIGPPPEAIEIMGDKISSRKAAAARRRRGGARHARADHRRRRDRRVRRASSAGRSRSRPRTAAAGKGMKVVDERRRGRGGVRVGRSARRRRTSGAPSATSSATSPGPRHIEIQVFADTHGNVRVARRPRLLDAAPAPEADRGERPRRRSPTRPAPRWARPR